MTSSSIAGMFKGSGQISAQDLLQLVKTSGKSTFLRVKTLSSIMHSVKWKQRFVIMANNEIYIYETEMSRKPSSCIPLLGFNKIQRYRSDKYPWSFSIQPAVSSVKQCVFSCATEEERRAWMRKIKDHMFKANNVERSFTDELNQLACGTEEEYLDLEEPVFLTDDVTLEKERVDFNDAESVDGFDSDFDDLGSSSRSTSRKFSIGSENTERELPPIPGSSMCSPPPRYSDLMRDGHTYLNDPEACAKQEEPTSISKLGACLITDPKLERNREKCRELLQTKSRLGVYLIRKSRQGENLVLVVLTENSDVKEYRLEENNNLYRLSAKNGDADFISLEALIDFFSHEAFLPGIKHFLTYGIFEYKEEIYEDM